MFFHRYTAAVIYNRDRVIFVNYYLGLIAVTGHRLVYAVVDYLVDQVMQSVLVGAADIHARAASYVREAVQYADILGGIVLLRAVAGIHSYLLPGLFFNLFLYWFLRFFFNLFLNRFPGLFFDLLFNLFFRHSYRNPFKKLDYLLGNFRLNIMEPQTTY